MPGIDVGLSPEDPTIAELLKPQGYATGQFGKNHLGDLNKHLPTNHGFDEFFGNLYHLNAEEEPETPDFPDAEHYPVLHDIQNPRGVIRSWATAEDAGEVDPKFGPYLKQRIEDTGPLNRKRMETIDDEIAEACIDYLGRQKEAGNPFFVWLNFTHMHLAHPHQAREHRPSRSLAVALPRHDGRPRQERRTDPRRPRRARSHRRHDRHLQHRQRPSRQLLARRRHHTVPQREGHQLGGRLPGPRADPLAGPHRAGIGLQRDRPAPRLAAHLPGRRRRA